MNQPQTYGVLFFLILLAAYYFKAMTLDEWEVKVEKKIQKRWMTTIGAVDCDRFLCGPTQYGWM